MPEIRIRDYQPELRIYFESLNREWLEKLFTVEPIDELYFKDPEGQIIKKDGEIFFAEVDGEIVGTCSLLWDDGHLEMAKMGVTEKSKGLGIGEFLVEEAIKRAKKKNVSKLTLLTNSKLIPAIWLYQKMGFKQIPLGSVKYARGDVMMERDLT